MVSSWHIMILCGLILLLYHNDLIIIIFTILFCSDPWDLRDALQFLFVISVINLLFYDYRVRVSNQLDYLLGKRSRWRKLFLILTAAFKLLFTTFIVFVLACSRRDAAIYDAVILNDLVLSLLLLMVAMVIVGTCCPRLSIEIIAALLLLLRSLVSRGRFLLQFVQAGCATIADWYVGQWPFVVLRGGRLFAMLYHHLVSFAACIAHTADLSSSVLPSRRVRPLLCLRFGQLRFEVFKLGLHPSLVALQVLDQFLIVLHPLLSLSTLLSQVSNLFSILWQLFFLFHYVLLLCLQQLFKLRKL